MRNKPYHLKFDQKKKRASVASAWLSNSVLYLNHLNKKKSRGRYTISKILSSKNAL